MRPRASASFSVHVSARGYVRFDRELFVAFERAESVEIEIFFASWMTVHVVMPPQNAEFASMFRPPSAAASSPCRADRPCACAISLCVMPSKYASSTAARCSFGRFSSAPFTRPSNCCCDASLSILNVETTVVSSSASPAAGLCRRKLRDRAIARNDHQPCGQRAARRRRIAMGASRAGRKYPARSPRLFASRAKSGSGRTKAFLRSGHRARRAPSGPAERFFR